MDQLTDGNPILVSIEDNKVRYVSGVLFSFHTEDGSASHTGVVGTISPPIGPDPPSTSPESSSLSPDAEISEMVGALSSGNNDHKSLSQVTKVPI